jgi:hypothetical protein
MENGRKPSQEIQVPELGDMRPRSVEGIQLQRGKPVELNPELFRTINGVYSDPS